MTREHRVEDRSFASRRPGVPAFESGESIEAVTAAGPLTPRFAPATGADSDRAVKRIAVYPAVRSK